jgi:hypothetical protein
MQTASGKGSFLRYLPVYLANPEVIAPRQRLSNAVWHIVLWGEAEWEMRLMTTEEKSAMKAACVQAAATLIAARDSGKGQIDVDECITLAALIYVRVVAIDWRGPG